MILGNSFINRPLPKEDRLSLAAFNQKPLAPPVGVIAVAVAVALGRCSAGKLGLGLFSNVLGATRRSLLDRSSS